jgi:G:T/U-mismatch repair DNA glycosylase
LPTEGKSRLELVSHPQNRFWKVLAAVLDDAEPSGREEQAAFFHRRHVALWDVLASCLVEAASDSSIRRPLASTSPANARFTLPALCASWQEVREALDQADEEMS